MTKTYRRNNLHIGDVQIQDDDNSISKILKIVSQLEGLNKKHTVVKALLLLLLKHKNCENKLKKLYKDQLRSQNKKMYLAEMRQDVYDRYTISNINSRLFDLCSKESQTPNCIFDYLRKALKVIKFIDPKIFRSQKTSWDKLKHIGVEQIKDYKNCIEMARRQGFTLKQIKLISSDYDSFKDNLKAINDGVVVFKKPNI